MAKKIPLSKNKITAIHKYVNILKQKGIKVSKVILFGSYAKGMATADSDIDIAIISPQFGNDNLKEMMLLRKLAFRVDSHIEPIPFSPEDLKDHYSTLTQEILKYGITL